jgi:hypothetical protein
MTATRISTVEKMATEAIFVDTQRELEERVCRSEID